MSIRDHARDLSDLLAETGFGPVRAVLGVAAGAAIAVTFAAQGGAADALILCAPALSVRRSAGAIWKRGPTLRGGRGWPPWPPQPRPILAGNAAHGARRLPPLSRPFPCQ